jgi:Uma2 family endonuclease
MSIGEQSALALNEFLELPLTKPASEFWDGQVRMKPMPMTRQSVIQGELTEQLDGAAKKSKPRHGRAMPELRCTFAGRSIVPDIADVRRERLSFEPDGRVADRFLDAPDAIIEIVSPEQSQFQLVEKLAWAVNNGAKLEWPIDLDNEEAMDFTPGDIPQVIPRAGALKGGNVLPGFRCPVSDVFGWLREQV